MRLLLRLFAILFESVLLRRFYGNNAARLRFASILSLIWILLQTNAAFGQWSLVAPALLGTISNQQGAITMQGGIVWAGCTRLYMSTDNGLSWTARTPTLYANDQITDVNFFDGNTGIVGTFLGSIYRTDDQGRTWSEIHRTASCKGLTFCGSINSLLVMSGAGAVAEYSIDGGVTWGFTPLDKLVSYAVGLGGANALGLSGSIAGASLYATNDHGQSWQKKAGVIPFDSYSFGVDPCTNNQVYVVNEEGSITTGSSQIFVSSDGGTTWNSPSPMPRIFFSGSISVSSNAVYCQTTANGVFRSTDLGLSWKSIGGPSAPYDTRLVSAIDDNLILAADKFGNIWRTTNSGGDTVRGLVRFKSLSWMPLSLFNVDTLLRCDPPDIDTVYLSSVSCNIPGVLGQQFSGPDSSNYKLVRPLPPALTGHDTIVVSFQPQHSGACNGTLNVALQDGTVLSIPLHGFGKYTHSISLGTLDASTDTIGGTVMVPIIVHGDSSLPALEFSLGYDTTLLVYKGSFSLKGVPFDLQSGYRPGHARLHIDSPSLAKDSLIGYAIFEGFPTNAPCSKVTFDSLNVIDSLMTCAFNPFGDAVSNVCLPQGCGVTTLSQFMRYRRFPTLMIYPNPARQLVSLIASDTLTGQMQILDVLGNTMREEPVSLVKSQPYSLTITALHRGKYFVRVQNQNEVRSLPLLIE